MVINLIFTVQSMTNTNLVMCPAVAADVHCDGGLPGGETVPKAENRSGQRSTSTLSTIFFRN